MKRLVIFMILCLIEGGMILGNYLGQYNCSKLSYAMIISAPFNAEQTLVESEKPFNCIINKAVASDLRKIFQKYGFE
jgi:hypothetical protein